MKKKKTIMLPNGYRGDMVECDFDPIDIDGNFVKLRVTGTSMDNWYRRDDVENAKPPTAAPVDKPKKKRGRKPLPDWLRRRRVFIRLLLPEESEWLSMLTAAGHESPTAFYQACVDDFLINRTEGRAFLTRSEQAKPKSN